MTMPMLKDEGSSTIVLEVPPAMVGTFWDDLLPDLAHSLVASHGEVSVDTVAFHVGQGNWILAVAADGEGYTGFVMLEPIQTEINLYVNIVFAGSHKLETLNALLDFTEDYAERSGAQIKWVSSHPKFMRYAKRRGYTARFVEYIKE